MDRFEQKSSATLELTIRSAGALVDANGVVNVDVYDGAGVRIVEDAVATKPADTTGTYRFALQPSQLAVLDDYTAVWKYRLAAGGEVHERPRRFRVVGQFYCTIDELRNLGANKTLADPAEFPDRKLVNYRELAEELLEKETSLAFSPQARRLTLSGGGLEELPIALRDVRSVVGARVGGVALTASEIAAIVVRPGALVRPVAWIAGTSNVELHVIRGMDEVPEDVREATMHIVRQRAESRTELDERALTLSNDAGTQRLAVAGRDGPTGIPFVDATIERWRRHGRKRAYDVATPPARPTVVPSLPSDA
jgi:hypothetical protein